ncbi:MAG: flagellar basal body rod protein FlgB [Alphaproteobacteria bacterium]
MDVSSIGLMAAMAEKMNHLTQRSRVLAQNIANADTPGYQPMDIAPFDFAEAMARVDQRKPITNFDGTGPVAARPDEQRMTYETAPAGNAVVLEEQVMMAAETAMDYRLVADIYRKNMGMMRLAINGSGQ